MRGGIRHPCPPLPGCARLSSDREDGEGRGPKGQEAQQQRGEPGVWLQAVTCSRNKV